MSYAGFKKYQGEFDEIFSKRSTITKLDDFADPNLNLVLSSAHIVGTLKPILTLNNMYMKMLDVT